MVFLFYLIIGECDPGNYYNETKGSCDECPINLYQNQAGQSFCIDCKLGFITEGTASDSDADCIGKRLLYDPAESRIPAKEGFGG